MNTTNPQSSANAVETPASEAREHDLTDFISNLERSYEEIVNATLGTGMPASEQIVAYELAMGKADLYAAKSLYQYAKRFGRNITDKSPTGLAGNLEVSLGLIGCVQVSFELKTRLEKVCLTTGISPENLHRVFADPALPKIAKSSDIEELGKLIVAQQSYGQTELDEEQQIIADSFHRFAEEIVAPLAEKIHREDLLVPDEILDPMREMGCFGLSIPEQFGGHAPEDRENHMGMVIVTEELSRGSLAAAGSLITRPEIMSKAILHGGTSEQREYWLPKISSGEIMCGIAVTEPDAGSDVAQMRLKATRTDNGWLLNGAKTWSTFAGKAELLLVLARTDEDPASGHRGLNLFLVEKPSTDQHSFVFMQDTDGKSAKGKIEGTAIPTMGYRGMHSFTLFFDDWFVPDNCLIGGNEAIGKGFYQTMTAFAGGRLQTAARANGLMRAAFKAAIDYANDRRVFGVALAEYQLTLAKLVKMAWLMRACQEMTYEVAKLMDDKKGQVEASLVKLYACRAAEYVTRECLQIHGGMGYSEETPASRYYVDARVLSIFEGAEETLALKVVAKNLIAAK
jgi:(2S)-methylsuccinyl-CoA dehydrogenase